MTIGSSGAGPAETGTYRIIIRDLVLSCRIGAHAHEKTGPQRVRINLELTLADTRRPDADELLGVLNYERVVDGIKKVAAAGHIHLSETLADRILDMVLALDPRIRMASILVEKLDLYPEAESIGVAMQRRRLT
jgi:dihydroneopterin aldolase